MVTVRCLVDKAQRLEDIGAPGAQAQNTVWQQTEIPRPRVRHNPHDLAPILDIVTNRGTIIVVHTGIHRKAQLLPLGLQGPIQSRELAENIARRVIEEKPQLLLSRHHGADRVTGFQIRDVFAA